MNGRAALVFVVAMALSACSSGGGGSSPKPDASTGTGGASTGSGGSSGSGGGGSSTGTGGASTGTGGAGTGTGATSGSGGADGGADLGTDRGGADSSTTDTSTGDGPAAETIAPGPVAPVLRNNRWVFEGAGVTFEVDPRVGGRVTGFGFGAENLLTDATVNVENWGSTFWTSPQAVWDWPPPPQIDNLPYTATATATDLTLTGPASPDIGVSVTKTFSMDRADGSVRLLYKVTNTRQTVVRVAPWEVTRVANRGLTFYPTGPTVRLSPMATLPTTNMGGVTWFNYNAADIRNDSKLTADALEGWLAYTYGGVLFIKKFPDVPAAMLAPNEGDVEIYTNMLRTYIELENQGPYTTIPVGGSLSWTVTWYLKRLPAGVTATPGNAALVQLVRDTVR